LFSILLLLRNVAVPPSLGLSAFHAANIEIIIETAKLFNDFV